MVFLLAVATGLTALFLDRPEQFADSDILLPVDFVWDVLHRSSAWFEFQQARCPSFFPDLILFLLVQAPSQNWRCAFAAFMFLMLLAFFLIGSRLVARIGLTSYAAATVGLALPAIAVLELALSDSLAASGSMGAFVRDVSARTITIMQPVTHGGSFILSLTALVMAQATLARPERRRFAVLAVLGWAAALSDMMYVFGFLLPLTVAVWAGLRLGSVPRAAGLKLLAANWCGGALGIASFGFVRHEGLPAPLGVDVIVPMLLAAFFLILLQWPIWKWIAAVVKRPFSIAAAVALGVGVVVLYRTLAGDRWLIALHEVFNIVLRGPKIFFLDPAAVHSRLLVGFILFVLMALFALMVRRDGWRAFLAGFWGPFAVTATALSLALVVLLYVDIGSERYVVGPLWWAIMLVAARLAVLFERRGPWTIAAGLTAVAALTVSIGLPHRPALFAYRPALAGCLQSAGLRAGLADYWGARATTIASDWALQVEPVDETGSAFHWGNDLYWFTHDRHDPTHVPDFHFVVMPRLTESAIVAVFGQPDAAIHCGGTLVWTYVDGAKLYRRLLDASPNLPVGETAMTAGRGAEHP